MCKSKYLFFSLFFVAFITCIYAQPDKLRAVYVEDPSTKLTLVFNTNNDPNTNPVVYYDTNSSKVANNTSAKAYRDNTLSNNSFDMYNNFVKLSDLIPDTKYYFKIKDNSGETQIYYFETIPDNPNKRLSFVCGGDSRQNRSVRQIANKIVSKLKPHAVFFDGDFTQSSNADQWQNWLDDWQSTISIDGHITPIVPARGNHERNNAELTDLFGTNSTATYALSFGGNLFRAYTLNSENTVLNYFGQTDWLRQELVNDQNYIYKFAQYHKPMRPHTKLKLDGASQYAFWASLFYQYSVDLVLEGDAHTASTSYAVVPCTGGFGCVDGFIEDETNGTVYTGQGTWGAPLRTTDDQRPWTFYGEMLNQFKLVFVDREKMEVRTIGYENSLSMAEVNINDRFNLPNTLSVEPGKNKLTGQPQDALIIPNKKSLTYPKIEIASPIDNVIYYNQVDVDVGIKNTATLNNINAVVFYLDGVNKGIDASEPFSWKFDDSEFSANRNYEINAIAYDADGVASPIASKRICFKSGSTYTVTSKLKDSYNDAEESSNGRVDVGNFDFDMGYNNFVCGLRFTNINLPYGVNILDGFIQFTADEVKFNPTDLTFHGEDNSNTMQFLPNSNDISGRAKTPMMVNWTAVPNWNNVGDSGPNQKTPDLKSILQHLVNRPDWDIESTPTFIIGGDGYRVSETFEGDSLSTPVLTVRYTTVSQILEAYCISHPDTIYTSIGETLNIIGAGFSNLNSIVKIEFIKKSNNQLLKTENVNPSMLSYSVAGSETIIIKVYDNAGNTETKEIFVNSMSDCNMNITATVSSEKENSAIIEWNKTPDTYYKIYYKTKNGNDWKTHCTPHSTMFLFGLNSCTDYEYQIQKICSGDYSDCENDLELGAATPILTLKTTGCGPKINNNNSDSELRITEKNIIYEAYPNPITDVLYVDLEVKEALTFGKVNLLNENGETIQSKNLQNNRKEYFEFNTANLPKGEYILEIDDGIKNQREVIKK